MLFFSFLLLKNLITLFFKLICKLHCWDVVTEDGGLKDGNSRRSTWPGLGGHSLCDKWSLNTLLCAKCWPGRCGLSSKQDRSGPFLAKCTVWCSGSAESNALHLGAATVLGRQVPTQRELSKRGERSCIQSPSHYLWHGVIAIFCSVQH